MGLECYGSMELRCDPWRFCFTAHILEERKHPLSGSIQLLFVAFLVFMHLLLRLLWHVLLAFTGGCFRLGGFVFMRR
jgi:hypothetical protein